MTEAPYAPPVDEVDDLEYAVNLRRATLASTVGSAREMLPEMFGNRHRDLGVAVSREFSAVIAGGLAGVLGAALIARFDGSWVPLGVYTFILARITLATTFLATEIGGRDLARIEDARRQAGRIRECS